MKRNNDYQKVSSEPILPPNPPWMHPHLKPADLLKRFWPLFWEPTPEGPVMDLACGQCVNGVFLATKGLKVICCDISKESLKRARTLSMDVGVEVDTWMVDLESGRPPPLRSGTLKGMVVFRYLHRPLFPWIRRVIKPGGIIVYETFTRQQARLGRPTNPDFLLEEGELASLFEGWQVMFCWEGKLKNPERAVAQLVAMRPKGD